VGDRVLTCLILDNREGLRLKNNKLPAATVYGCCDQSPKTQTSNFSVNTTNFMIRLLKR